MKFLYVLFIALLSSAIQAQALQLFYENGGALGPIEIRDGLIVYVEQQVAFKTLDLDGNLLDSEVDLTDLTYEDILFFDWNDSGDEILMGSYYRLLWAPYGPSQDSQIVHLGSSGGEFWDVLRTPGHFTIAHWDLGANYICLDSSTVNPYQIVFNCSYPSAPGRVRRIDGNNEVYVFAHSENNTSYSISKVSLPYSSITDEVFTLLENENQINDMILVGEKLYYIDSYRNELKWINTALDSSTSPIVVATPDSNEIKMEYLAYHNESNQLFITDSKKGNVYTYFLGLLSTEESTNPEALIYPNPSSGKLFMELDEPGAIFIYNIKGQLADKNINMQAGKGFVDIEHLPSGVYFVEFRGLNNKIVSKIIKQEYR